jgi:hypothetical protein
LEPGGKFECIRWSAVASVEIIAVIHLKIDESTEAATKRREWHPNTPVKNDY